MNKTISKKSRKSKEKTPPQCGVIMKNSPPPWIRGSDYKPRGMGGNSKTPNHPLATNFFRFLCSF